MKTNITTVAALCIGILLGSCSGGSQPSGETATAQPADGGQSTVEDNDSQKDVAHVAMGSADHSTLVTAIKAAELVDALSNAGPFTVFAPTNAAFDKLPAGTVESLLEPKSKESLQNILYYHVAVGVYKLENLKDGQTINQVNLDNVTIGIKDGKYTVNGAEIAATVPASNGIIYIIDGVLLPPEPKK